MLNSPWCLHDSGIRLIFLRNDIAFEECIQLVSRTTVVNYTKFYIKILFYRSGLSIPLGDRAFNALSPHFWNDLPYSLR